MKRYAVAIHAERTARKGCLASLFRSSSTRGLTDFESVTRAHVISALNDGAARQKARLYAQKTYPKAGGWQRHKVDVQEIR